MVEKNVAHLSLPILHIFVKSVISFLVEILHDDGTGRVGEQTFNDFEIWTLAPHQRQTLGEKSRLLIEHFQLLGYRLLHLQQGHPLDDETDLSDQRVVAHSASGAHP